jgi:hydrogenase expression/formation protein HypE
MKIESDKILLDHGSGGMASHELINELLYPHFENSILAEMDDGAVITLGNQRLAFSTDSYTVDPIFFPGGNIGELAVNGTVNDLAMCGAKPRYLSVGFIIEEGFPVKDLKIILESMKRASVEAGVQIVTGDTKVVHRGAADKIFINTAGIGTIADGIHISGKNARPGDKVIVSGYIADHGITILTQREGLRFDSPIRSDTASLNHMVEEMMTASRNIHTLRDPTRGGLATTLNEIAIQAGVGIKLYETEIPVRDETRGACELLGIDPLYIANEGKLIACVAPEDAETVLAAVRNNPYGKDAAVIGEVLADNPGKVFMETLIGGARIIDMLTGEPLPRIC